MSIFLILFLEKIAVPFFTISVPFYIMYIKYFAAAPILQESLQNLIKNVLRNILQIPELRRQEKWPATQFLLTLLLMKPIYQSARSLSKNGCSLRILRGLAACGK